jgi:hypothetical protein
MVIRMHPEMQVGLRRDAGPASAEEFQQLGDKWRYNGDQGGKYFRWYCPNIFARELKRLRTNATRENCWEHEAMEALRSTSVQLSAHNLVTQRFLSFAGPQCYAQLLCGKRDLW